MFSKDVADITLYGFLVQDGSQVNGTAECDGEIVISPSRKTCRFSLIFPDGTYEAIITSEDEEYRCRIPFWYGEQEVPMDVFKGNDDEAWIFKCRPTVNDTLFFEVVFE